MIRSQIVGRKNMDETVIVRESENTSTTITFYDAGHFRLSFNLRANRVQKHEELEGIDLSPDMFRAIEKIVNGRL